MTTEALVQPSSDVAPPAAVTTASVEAFDFRHPPRLGRAKRAGLDTIFGRFALSTQAFLSSRLRSPADVVLEGVEQGVFSEYISSLGAPCAAIVFELRSDRTYPCVMNFGNEFGFYLIDRLLGGSGVGSLVERTMTPLEQTVLKGLAENILGRLADAWKDDLGFEVQPVGFESFPEVLGSLCADETVLVTTIRVDSFKFNGGFSLTIPIRALESFLHDSIAHPRLDAASPEEIHLNREHLARAVRNCAVDMDVRLPLFTLRARDLKRFAVGDVIRTGHTTTRKAELLVNGQPRFLGKIGVLDGHMSARIEDVLGPDAPASSWKPEGVLL